MFANKRNPFRSLAIVTIALGALFGSSAQAEAGLLGPSSSYIVKITPEARATVETAIKNAGGRVDNRFQYAFDGFVVNLPDALIPILKKIPNILTVEKDMPVSGLDIQQNQKPTPSWGLDRIDQREKVSTATDYQGNYGYRSAGKGSTIYIGDTGIYPNEDIAGRISPVGFTGIADGNGTVDCNGHGTHVSTTAAGTKYGVAKNATLVPVRILNCVGSGSYSTVIAGLDWILSPLNTNPKSQAVLNLSIGGGYSTSINDAILRLTNAGITVVAAAGNDSKDACTTSPASAPSAITVGATNILDARASFSNFGPCLDIFAPGQGITGGWIGSTSATNTISGTSMATPHVTGAAAVFLGLNPTASVAQVADALKNESTKGALTNLDTATVNNMLFVSPTDGGPAIIEPKVIVNTITGITHQQAVANVEINPNNAPTTASLEYGTDSTFTTGVKRINLTPTPVSGGDSIALTATLTGLSASSEYFFRATASNEAGAYTTPVGSFKSLAPPVTPPTPLTKPASKITGWSATLNGTMNANNGSTTVSFVYSSDPTFTSSATTALASTQTVTGSTAVPVSVDITFLDPKTVYYFKLVGSNSAASVTSQVDSFTTMAVSGSLASVETIRPTNGISVPKTTVTGLVNPQGQTTSVRFVWGSDASLTVGQRIIELPTKYTGIDTVTVSADIVDPLPGIRYYYRFEATNAAGVTKPTPLTNVTNPIEPVIATTVGNNQTQTSVQLNTLVNPGGSNSRISFIYGTDSKLETGTTTINGDPFAIILPLSYSIKATVTGLKPNTTYYFRTKVLVYTGPLLDKGGVLLGPIMSVQTLAPVRTPQTITFNLPASRPFVAAPTLLTATSSSGLPITYTTTTPTICGFEKTETATYLVAAKPIPALSGAMCTVNASQNGDDTYAPAVGIGKSITFTKLTQRIAFAAPANKEMNTLNNLSISTPSGLAISVATTTPNACSVLALDNGTWAAQVNPSASGDSVVCTVTASQAGDDVWAAAPTETRSFTWSRAYTSIKNTLSAPITAAGVNLDSLILDRSGVALNETLTGTTPLTYTSLTPAICKVDSASYIGSSTAHSRAIVKSLWNGTCQITVAFAGSGQVKNATITYAATVSGMTTPEVGAGASQTISFVQPATSSIGSDVPLSVSSSSKLEVTVTSATPNICTVTKNANGQWIAQSASGLTGDSNICQLTASQAGDERWAAAPSVSKSFTFKRKVQTITFALAASRFYGGAPTSLNGSSSSGLPITYSVTTPAVCKVVTSGAGSALAYVETISASSSVSCTVVASQAGDGTFSPAASISRSITWTKESTSITPTWTGGITVAGTTLNLFVASTSQPSLNELLAGAAPLSVTSKTPTICKVEPSEYVGSSTVHTKVLVKAIWNGTCSLSATFAGNSYWLGTSATINSAISGMTTPQPGANAAQSISVSAPTTTEIGVISSLTPVATSKLPVTITVTTPTICEATQVQGGYTLKAATGVTGNGNICTIELTQPGSDAWAAAAKITRNITFNKAATAVRFTRAVASITGKATALFVGATTYATAALNNGLTSIGNVATIGTSTPTVCSVSPTTALASNTGDQSQATITALTNGTCVVTLDYPGSSTANAATRSQNVSITGIK